MSPAGLPGGLGAVAVTGGPDDVVAGAQREQDLGRVRQQRHDAGVRRGGPRLRRVASKQQPDGEDPGVTHGASGSGGSVAEDVRGLKSEV